MRLSLGFVRFLILFHLGFWGASLFFGTPAGLNPKYVMVLPLAFTVLLAIFLVDGTIIGYRVARAMYHHPLKEDHVYETSGRYMWLFAFTGWFVRSYMAWRRGLTWHAVQAFMEDVAREDELYNELIGRAKQELPESVDDMRRLAHRYRLADMQKLFDQGMAAKQRRAERYERLRGKARLAHCSTRVDELLSSGREGRAEELILQHSAILADASAYDEEVKQSVRNCLEAGDQPGARNVIRRASLASLRLRQETKLLERVRSAGTEWQGELLPKFEALKDEAFGSREYRMILHDLEVGLVRAAASSRKRRAVAQ